MYCYKIPFFIVSITYKFTKVFQKNVEKETSFYAVADRRGKPKKCNNISTNSQNNSYWFIVIFNASPRDQGTELAFKIISDQ